MSSKVHDTVNKIRPKDNKGMTCCVPQCHNHGKMHGIRMLTFPANFEGRANWAKRIRREHFVPTYNSRICSWHFLGGDRKKGPIRFEWNKDKHFDLVFPPTQSTEEVQPDIHLDVESLNNFEACKNDACILALEEVKNENKKLLHDLNAKEEEIQILKNQLLAIDHTRINKYEERIKFLESKESQQTKQITNLNNLSEVFKFKNSQMSKKIVSFGTMEHNPHFTMLTGMNVEVFKSLMLIVEKKQITYEMGWKVKTLSLNDQFFIFLIKMRHDVSFQFLAMLFGRSRTTIANTFYTFLYLCHSCFYKSLMTNMPSLNKVATSLPLSFKDFENCRVVIDCTEFLIENPRKLSQKCMTYSNYKSRNTFKVLVGVAPNGSLVYVSELYGGCTSDKAIVLDSKFLDQLVVGDMVMADKGFLLHDVMPAGVSLVTPDYLVNPQFTKLQVIRNKLISKARVHVERKIQRIRIFKIVNYIPVSLRPHASVIIQVAGFLSNCMPPILKENVN